MVTSGLKKLLGALPIAAIALALSCSAHALKLKISTDFDDTMVKGELLNSTAQGERVNTLDVGGICNPGLTSTRCPFYVLNFNNDNELYLDNNNNVMPYKTRGLHSDYERFLVSPLWKSYHNFNDRYIIIPADKLKVEGSKYGSIDTETTMVQRNNLINFYKGNRKAFMPLTSPYISLSEFVSTCDNNKLKCDGTPNNKFGFQRVSHVGRATDPTAFYVIIVRHNDSAADAKERAGGYTRTTDDSVLSKDIPSHLRFQVIPVKFKPVYEKEGIG